VDGQLSSRTHYQREEALLMIQRIEAKLAELDAKLARIDQQLTEMGL